MTLIDFSLPSSSIDVSTPDGLLEVLRRGVFKPATGQFEDTRDDGETGYCCLGVYAKVNGIAYDGNNAALFWNRITTGDESVSRRYDPELPAEHWLFTPVVVQDGSERWSENTIQGTLANANDRDTSDAYAEPIKVLEAFIAGCRKFDITGRESIKPVW
jgi:hypothetical protein